MERTTYRATLEYIIANCDLPKTHLENAEKLLDSLSRKRSVDKEKEAERTLIKNICVEHMTADYKTVTDWLMTLPLPKGTTSQKLTAYLTQLCDEGKVKNIMERGKSLYRKVV